MNNYPWPFNTPLFQAVASALGFIVLIAALIAWAALITIIVCEIVERFCNWRRYRAQRKLWGRED